MALLHREASPTASTILVVGAGPAGLAVSASLRALGMDVDLVDSRHDVGGVWDTGTAGSPARPDTRMVTSRGSTQFEDLRMPVSFPAFPTASQMGTYLKAYAAHHDLDDVFRPGITVRSATPFGSADRGDSLWQVEFSDGRTIPYPAIVLATGTAWHPRLPAWAGHPESSGSCPEIIHSSAVTDPGALTGRRVLVVGGGTGAAEAVHTAIEADASDVRLSPRSGHWVVQREILGIPGDRLAAARPSPLGALNARIGEKVLAATTGRPETFGLPAPDTALLDDEPTVSDTLFADLSRGQVTPVAQVAELADDGSVVLVGGERWHPDVIICATGYEPVYDMLPEDVIPFTDGAPDLFLGAFPRERDDLVVLGQFRATGADTIDLTSQQADVAAYFLHAVRGGTDGSGADPEQAALFRSVRREQPITPVAHRSPMVHRASSGSAAAPERHLDLYRSDELRHALRVVRSIFEPGKAA